MKLDESGTLEVSRSDLEIYLRRDAVIGIRAGYANCKAAENSNIPDCNEDKLRPHLALLLSTGGEIEVGSDMDPSWPATRRPLLQESPLGRLLFPQRRFPCLPPMQRRDPPWPCQAPPVDLISPRLPWTRSRAFSGGLPSSERLDTCSASAILIMGWTVGRDL